MLDVFEIELFSVAPPGFKLGVKRKTLREQLNSEGITHKTTFYMLRESLKSFEIKNGFIEMSLFVFIRRTF